jgi:hypothetical protein
MITETTLMSWIALQPSISRKQRAVYQVISAFGPIDNVGVSRALGWPINTVTPRVLELRKSGLVIPHDYATSQETNRSVTRWKTI